MIYGEDMRRISDLRKYVNLLLTYNNYNTLNVNKNETKLNSDIIFKVIIEYS